jgi:hypothetical protein
MSGFEKHGGMGSSSLFQLSQPIAPAFASPGETVTVMVLVSNFTEYPESADPDVDIILLDSARREIARVEASVPANTMRQYYISFTAPSTPGVYRYYMQAYNVANGVVDSEVVFEITVRKFVIEDYTSNVTVVRGEKYIVWAKVRNASSTSGIAGLRLVDSSGNVIGSFNAEIQPNGVVENIFELTAPDVETSFKLYLRVYDTGQSLINDEKTVTVNVVEREQPSQPSFSFNQLFQIIAVVLNIAILAAVMHSLTSSKD